MHKVVLVDDEKIVLEGIQKVYKLEEYGFEVVGAFTDARYALTQIEKLDPQLIISDMKMPDMTGLEFIDNAKNIVPNAEFVVLSGHGDFVFAQESLKLGVADYLLKPVKKEAFAQMLVNMREKIDKKLEDLDYKARMENWIKDNATDYPEFEQKAEKDDAQKPEEEKSPARQSGATGKTVIKDALDYIEKHYCENISLADVADAISISKNYLANLFKKEMNVTLINYVTNLRIEEAKRLLKEERLKMYEVAEAVGYNDYAYFSQIFKKHTGVTLSDYKSENA